LKVNGFVKFDHNRDLEEFLAIPRVASIKDSGRVFQSSSQPVLILRELSSEDLTEIEALAETHGGKVKPSVQYEPL
jgi:hypothetical protein